MTRRVDLYVRAQWSPVDPADMETDRRAVGAAVAAEPILGTTWFRPARSGSLRPVPITTGELRAGQGWTRERLIEGQYMHRLVLSNGLANGAEIGVSGTLFESTPDRAQVVVSLPEPDLLRADGVPFQAILSLARQYATLLEGIAVVSSSDLFARAQELGLPAADKVAYAAFWAEPPPGELIACRSWDELVAPDLPTLRAIQDRLSS